MNKLHQQEDYKRKDADFREQNRLYETMEQTFRDGQAGILAAKLKEGEACPVCGSTSHPKPAAMAAQVPSEQELDAAKEKADRFREAREKSAREAGAKKSSLEKTEEQLMAHIPEKDWTDAHHWIIFHGRRVCAAQRPKCDQCALNKVCDFYTRKDS